MRYGEFKINRAVGVILCSDLQLGEKFYPKGHTINAEDIIIFKMFNLSSIVGAVFIVCPNPYNLIKTSLVHCLILDMKLQVNFELQATLQ